MHLPKHSSQYFSCGNAVVFFVQNCTVAALSFLLYYNSIFPVHYIIALMGMLFIITGFYTFYKIDKTSRNYSSDAELKALRAQMNPHFIFNSLNSINNFIAKNETANATAYLSKFANLMRMALENSEKKFIPLSDDLKLLELYMQLESKRLAGKFDYTIIIANNINTENTLIPPMILQPFVENSIWHGFATKKDKGNIMIDISLKGKKLQCIIADDGSGFSKNESPVTHTNQSLGMKITKARIDIINKAKKSNGLVELSDMGNGVKVLVNLPLKLSF